MKRITVIVIFLSFVMSESTLGQVNLDLAAGINLSKTEFKNFEGTSPESRLGYFIEIAPNYQLNEKVSLLMNFQYSEKGYKTRNTTNQDLLKFKHSYIDFMPEVEYNVLDYLAFGFGMYYGIKLNEQFKFEDGEWTDVGDVEFISSTDFGLTGKVKVNYKNIFWYVRYSLGLNDISNVVFTDVNGQSIDDAKQLNRNLQIGMGYSLDLSKN